MGNLDSAEKYLDAAWKLGQNGEVADHLSQVYEQQHKKTLAQQMHRGVDGGELSKMRTTKLPRVVNETASAEFFVLFGPGGRVEDTKFVSGSQKLATAGKTLSATSYNITLPDDGPTRLVRRGLLSCSSITGCVIVLYLPQDVHSVD